VSTTVEATPGLRSTNAPKSEVKVTVGKVKALDLVRKKAKTLRAGKSYIALAKQPPAPSI
jgi:hypothetical protein